MTRLYRAPEVICAQKHYGKPGDVWSLGCVLLELMLALDKKPRHLFKGKHCSPLSPRKNVEKEDHDDD